MVEEARTSFGRYCTLVGTARLSPSVIAASCAQQYRRGSILVNINSVGKNLLDCCNFTSHSEKVSLIIL